MYRKALLILTVIAAFSLVGNAGNGGETASDNTEGEYVIPFDVELSDNKKKVTVSTDMRSLEVDLIDMNGTILRTVTIENNRTQISVKNLESGMYFIIAPVGYIPFEI